MRSLLQELRGVIEREASLHGPLVPLDAPPTDTDEDASATEDDAPTVNESSPSNTYSQPGEAATDDASSVDADDLPAPSTASDASAGDALSSTSSSNDASMPNQDLFGNEVDPTEDPSRPPSERIEALIPDDAPYKDIDSLAELEKWVAENTLVPIDEDRKNPVFGVGDPNADLLIIGEAPGANEDEQGEPFVGRAGKLLDKILQAIEFDRQDVYIANILKSRPPNNRDPLAEEVEAHIPILYKQIALIQPAIILCVGKVATNTMLDRRSSLGSLREKEHDFYGIPLYATYHPAALLRNSNWKRPTWEDVKLVRTRYDELTGTS
ncbi:uracil-DNA glycosylase [Longibacter salinarum]|uniref:Type-4 uracil-DNA glycosylase n=1 Tax=Longibacter salinarum TaxID=1850348 RepID=A0A2A8CV18_9BACT|nr:uracil-DNA glycosylase [Longibacter salinarum]PEN12555.1 uracil-DNA glycosylase [Longibacter salinarum]